MWMVHYSLISETEFLSAINQAWIGVLLKKSKVFITTIALCINLYHTSWEIAFQTLSTYFLFIFLNYILQSFIGENIEKQILCILNVASARLLVKELKSTKYHGMKLIWSIVMLNI